MIAPFIPTRRRYRMAFRPGNYTTQRRPLTRYDLGHAQCRGVAELESAGRPLAALALPVPPCLLRRAGLAPGTTVRSSWLAAAGGDASGRPRLRLPSGLLGVLGLLGVAGAGRVDGLGGDDARDV